jgi:hypothetical protein
MRLTYLQKLGRGWLFLYDLFWVAVHCGILVGIAFLPLNVVAWIATSYSDTLHQGLVALLAVIGMAYGIFVGPVVLFNLVKFCGFPWRWVKDPTRTEKADRTVALIAAEPARVPEQELQSPPVPRES